MGEEMIETAIVEALQTVVARVYPCGAPEKAPLPFVVYISGGTTEDDSLSGWIGSYNTEMEINVLHKSYRAMKTMARDVVNALKAIEDLALTISEDAPEGYEREIMAWRKAINIKIMH